MTPTAFPIASTQGMFSERLTARVRAGIQYELVVDNFAGGGGASLGIEAALGRCVDIAINHCQRAIKIHTINHPNTRHLCEDVWDVDPFEATGGRPVGFAWFSPDCKDHSNAKSGQPLNKNIRGLAWVVLRWILAVRPRVIMLENVEEFTGWCPLIQKVDADGNKMFHAHCVGAKRKTRGRNGKENKGSLSSLPAGDGELVPTMVRDNKRKGEYFQAFVGAMSDGMLPSLELVDELQEFFKGHAPLYRLMKGCGYKVEWRTLSAADYGVPTTRKRLFMIARCDGEPIVWPEKTHAPRKKAKQLGLKPYRSAAECIDWSIPCPSIFERTRPLADATMRRIARGITRHVIESKEPFIVCCNHGGDWGRNWSVDEPLRTITASRDAVGIVVPHVSKYYTGVVGSDVQEPLSTVTAIDHNALVSPTLIPIAHYNGSDPAHDHSDPLRTITAHPKGGHFAMANATLVQVGYGEREGQAPRVPDLDNPLGTIVGSGKHAMVQAFMQRFRHGEVEHVPLQNPMQTITAGGNHHAIVSATLVTNTTGHAASDLCEQPMPTHCVGAIENTSDYTAPPQGVVETAHLSTFYGNTRHGQSADDPTPTITGGGNHHAVVSASLVGVGGRAGQSPERGADDPVGTITSKADRAVSLARLARLHNIHRTGQNLDDLIPPNITNHVEEVFAFFTKYYSNGSQDQSCGNPMDTITAKARIGLVTIRGIDYQIVDIGLRMLTPQELLRAQFGRFADEYILTGTASDKVSAIGNSVCPELAELLVKANVKLRKVA